MEKRGTVAMPLRQQAGTWVRWTKAMRSEFLDHLAGSCNITAAAAATGIPAQAAHRMRRRNPGFAAAWEQALDAGYMMLETRLVGHVLSGHRRNDPLAPAGEGPESIDVDQALRLLAEREVRRTGVRSRKAAAPDRLTRATPAETDAAILRKLDAVRAPAVDA